MADLFRDQVRGPRLVLPFSNKYFAQERVQWFHLLPLPIVILITMLLLERTQEPFQD